MAKNTTSTGSRHDRPKPPSALVASQIQDAYPERPPFFANRFVRLLTKAAVAQDVGPEVCWLLTVVAHQEDVIRYARPVTFWNGQLMPLCGFGGKSRLVRARTAAVDAGWLHYESGGKGKPGRYWVCIPSVFLHLDDSPIDESTDSLCCTETGRQIDGDDACRTETGRQVTGGDACRPKTVQQNGICRPETGADQDDKPSPFKPIPNKKKEELSEFEFMTKSGTWTLPVSKLDEYQETHDRLDIPSELRKARQWLRDKPNGRKTPRGMPAFLGRWLNKASAELPAPPRMKSVAELQRSYRA